MICKLLNLGIGCVCIRCNIVVAPGVCVYYWRVLAIRPHLRIIYAQLMMHICKLCGATLFCCHAIVWVSHGGPAPCYGARGMCGEHRKEQLRMRACGNFLCSARKRQCSKIAWACLVPAQVYASCLRVAAICTHALIGLRWRVHLQPAEHHQVHTIAC